MVEQNKPVRSRDDQVDALYHGHNRYSTITQDGFRNALIEAEARGAAEQRRKDGEGSLRPMPEAKKDGSVILAKIHDDLFPRVKPNRSDLKPWNGRWVVVNHSGILEDGFDLGWSAAAPVGHGGFPDDWFVGWRPLNCPANVAALEGRIAELEGALKEIIDTAGADCIHGLGPYIKIATAALTRTGTPS